jgi:hypothetical protein
MDAMEKGLVNHELGELWKERTGEKDSRLGKSKQEGRNRVSSHTRRPLPYE